MAQAGIGWGNGVGQVLSWGRHADVCLVWLRTNAEETSVERLASGKQMIVSDLNRPKIGIIEENVGILF